MADYPVRPAPVIVRGRATASQVAGIDAELTTQTAHLADIETATETVATTLASGMRTAANAAMSASAGTLPVRSISEDIDIARGLRTGMQHVFVFGYNNDVDGAEDIWNGGGDYTGFPTGSAETVTIVSTDANDASGGTGARTVKIFGLDSNWALAEETLTMNGLTLVTSSGTFRRVYKVEVITAGSGNTNAGALTVAHSTTTANIFSVVPAGYSLSQMAVYTIPAGYTGYLIGYESELLDNTTNTGVLAFKIRKDGGPWLLERTRGLSTTYPSDHWNLAIPLPAKTDIVTRCISVQNTNAKITATFKILLVAN